MHVRTRWTAALASPEWIPTMRELDVFYRVKLGSS